ncbi:hypothetical protein J6590_045716 [Homalodisca vitripennis]|nr:hypothetical protein J6590_045716 [Homalodisca vitripennis]
MVTHANLVWWPKVGKKNSCQESTESSKVTLHKHHRSNEFLSNSNTRNGSGIHSLRYEVKKTGALSAMKLLCKKVIKPTSSEGHMKRPTLLKVGLPLCIPRSVGLPLCVETSQRIPGVSTELLSKGFQKFTQIDHTLTLEQDLVYTD